MTSTYPDPSGLALYILHTPPHRDRDYRVERSPLRAHRVGPRPLRDKTPRLPPHITLN
jgi:hypothetical protein